MINLVELLGSDLDIVLLKFSNLLIYLFIYLLLNGLESIKQYIKIQRYKKERKENLTKHR